MPFPTLSWITKNHKFTECMFIVCLYHTVEQSAKTLNPSKYQNCCISLQYNVNFLVWLWKNTVTLNKCYKKLRSTNLGEAYLFDWTSWLHTVIYQFKLDQIYLVYVAVSGSFSSWLQLCNRETCVAPTCINLSMSKRSWNSTLSIHY